MNHWQLVHSGSGAAVVVVLQSHDVVVVLVVVVHSTCGSLYPDAHIV